MMILVTGGSGSDDLDTAGMGRFHVGDSPAGICILQT